MSMCNLLCCYFANRPSRERQISTTKGSYLPAGSNSLTKVFEELKCPICFNVCIPPIHNCTNGHIICNNCRQKGNVVTCPTCRNALNGARNHFAEKFVRNYVQRCKYAEEGCEHVQLKGCTMRPHEEKCMFRPIRCIVGSCSHEIPYKNFLQHLDCAHKISGTTRLPMTFQLKYNPRTTDRKYRWYPYYIQAFENLYYVMMQKISSNFWIWVYFQTSKESDNVEYNYINTIQLTHPQKNMVQSWTGPVYSIRTPVKHIISESSCLVLPEVTMRNFVSRGCLTLTIDIQKFPRRSLRGVTLPQEDCTTLVAATSSLPEEYSRSPSFYEPALAPPVDPVSSVDENGNIIEEEKSQSQTINQLPLQRSQQRTRSPAIGILRNNSRVIPLTTTVSYNIPPASLVLSNDDMEQPEKDNVDNAPSQSTRPLDSSKSFVHFRKLPEL